MNILLLGAKGQLGFELGRTLSSLGQLIALDRKGSFSLCGDLSNLSGLSKTIREIQPDVLINAAAYTAVDRAEAEPEQVELVNTKAPALMAEEVKKLNAWFVHYSTDYVFHGSGNQPWKETDIALPLNLYGQSKLEGEKAIQASGCKHLIFRTSWVYGRSGYNFVKTILQLAKAQEEIRVVSDQIAVPTSTLFLASHSISALEKAENQPNLSGLYHLVPQGEISWYDFACFIIEKVKSFGLTLRLKKIHPIQTKDYPTKAKRPLNSRLATQKFTENFAMPLPHWQEGFDTMLEGILCGKG